MRAIAASKSSTGSSVFFRRDIDSHVASCQLIGIVRQDLSHRPSSI